MDSSSRVRSFYYKTRRGFAIAEVVIAIALVSMAVLIVGGLGQQVLNLAKSSRQTAAVIEIRTKTNSISRNLDSWLSKMRSSLETSGLYAACIPDPSAATSIFNCPAVDAAILDGDAELKRIAGTQLHAASAPVIDLLGERLAGTLADPLYLDLDGRKCQMANPGENCPLKSVGFFLRSNPLADSTPGSIRFVVKLEPNRSAPANKGSAPQRTQYLSIDVGSEWNQVAGFCPAGSIKIGYLASGTPNCIHPTKKCASGTIALGLDSSANPICATPPASCPSGGAIVDTASNTLVCSQNSPCSSNQIFLGYYSGTGTPMCSGTDISCPNGQVQVGIQGSAGSLTALCKTLPSCQDSQKLSYDGSQFVCKSASVASNCADGEVVTGINTDGSAICKPEERNLASTNLDCGANEVMVGIRSDGSVKCRSETPRIPEVRVFSTPGTYSWTVPPGVTRVSIEAWGGGGGGCGGQGGSGGGGSYSYCIINTVQPGQIYTVTVGNGGPAQGSYGDSGPCGTANPGLNRNSSFSGNGYNSCIAIGGSNAAAGAGYGGSGGSGDVVLDGQNGVDIGFVPQMAIGGSSPRGGAGGHSANGTGPEYNGKAPGGGGSALEYQGGNVNYDYSGAGAPGAVHIKW